MHDSDYVMICTTSITSISNTFNNLWIPLDLNTSYIQTMHNDKEKIINNVFITYVESLLENNNHPA